MDMSRHPSAEGAEPTEAPACAGEQATPNLPAFIASLSSDATRAPQTEFTRARQVLFLENLSVTGSVRSAAAAGGASHQSAYRARRSLKPFRLAWDAALVLARTHAEGTLACRAIDGVEEKVFYHGEEVATRTRYSDRLLLAHLARLDRLTADERINAVAEDFDAALVRLEAGEEVLVPVTTPARAEPVEARSRDIVDHSDQLRFRQAQDERTLCEECGEENFSPGPCNTRSMSYSRREADWHPDDLADAMTLARPDDAPPLELLGDPEEVAACQREIFVESPDEEWWTIGADFITYIRDAAGGWVPDPEELAQLARDSGEDESVDDGAEEDAAEAGTGPDAEEQGAPADAEGQGAPADAAQSAADRGGMAEAQDPPASGPAPETEPSATPGLEAGSGLEGESAAGATEGAAPPRSPAPAPVPAPAPRSWRPINDGRMQPFHGRGY